MGIMIEGAEEFAAEVVFAQVVQRAIRAVVFKNVRAAALQAQRGIRMRMPVDTGAARARWGSKGPGGIWTEDEGKLEVVQGANLQPYEYIIRLNEGYSKQAPAGFIDVEAEKASILMGDSVGEAIVKAMRE